MTNLAVARRADSLGESSPPKSAKARAKATGGRTETEGPLTAALKAIATYIPTGVIGLYIAALAAVRSSVTPTTVSASTADKIGTVTKVSSAEVWTLVVFAIATPAIVWLVYAGPSQDSWQETSALAEPLADLGDVSRHDCVRRLGIRTSGLAVHSPIVVHSCLGDLRCARCDHSPWPPGAGLSAHTQDVMLESARMRSAEHE